jgi:hypothetical protein
MSTKGIELLFNQMKAIGKYRQYKDYADYVAKNNLEKIRDEKGDTITRDTEGAIGFKKQRPMFGHTD